MTHRLLLVALLSLPACGSEEPAVANDPSPPTEPELTFTPIALGLTNPTDFQFVPGSDDELLVIAKEGGVHRFQLADTNASELDSTAIAVFPDDGCGLLGMAFDPAFADNGYLYLGRCVDSLTSTLSRYDLGALAELEASASEIMTVTAPNEPREFWHRWGSLGFEPDGETMWALYGDMFIRRLAADPTTPHGSLLRFIPNREAGGSGHEPADGNAFADAADGDPSVYAYGFRSPWRGYRDGAGRFWVGDVGLSTWEEVDLVTEPGQNFGWPLAEGVCVDDCADLRDPLLSFGRSADEPYVIEDPDTEPATKRAVWVGVAYESPSVDRYYGLLDGLLLYGDFFTGWVRGAKVDDGGSVDVDRLLGHLTDVTSVRLGPDGYLYLLSLNGNLYRAEQALK